MVTKEQYSKQYKYRKIIKAKLFIDKNFSEAIDLNQIADQANFSKFHFIRLFKNIYDITPNQYLTAVRIEKAKSLLKDSKSIDEVCISVGFDSVSTFKGLFKRETNYTPTDYKKQQSDLKVSMHNNPTTHIPNCILKVANMNKKSNFKDNS
jgi:AraC-like DNA-binding protein